MGRLHFTPTGEAFLPCLAEAWAAHVPVGNGGRGMIILPTRRAVRALSAAFLAQSARQALILPRIVSLGDIDEVSVFFSTGLKLLPAMRDTRRNALLSALILARRGEGGSPVTAAGAWSLARELSSLVDEAARSHIQLHSNIGNLADVDLSVHWQRTVSFLSIVTEHLPRIMKQQKALSAEDRRIALMQSQCNMWDQKAPSGPVWLAGISHASAALSNFASGVMRLPEGRIILSGYDPATPDVVWDAIDVGSTHPAAGHRSLIAHLGMTREDVTPLLPRVNAAAMRGCPTIVRNAFGMMSDVSEDATLSLEFERVSLLQARDEHEEARAIAMAIRQEVETPQQTIAFVTPDRGQAARVAGELARFGIHAEDSAGDPVMSTPPGVFLRLVTDMLQTDFDSVSVASLLKHPFTSLGLPTSDCRRLGRAVEMSVLRALHPAAGLEALIHTTATLNKPELRDLVERLAEAFAPLTSLDKEQGVDIPTACTAIVACIDALAASGREDVWSGEAGSTLSNALTTISADADTLITVRPRELSDFFAEALAEFSVRRPRAKDAHARIAIWGLIEARLQTVDTVIVGGLTEGVLPGSADPGPWLSRPMRRQVGLPLPEDKISEEALDFSALLMAARKTILAVPLRTAGAPAVPSRFVARIQALASRFGGLERHPAADWALQLDTPLSRVNYPRPEPRPAAEFRPHSLSISDIGTLMADPYSIYARHVLGIRSIDPLTSDGDYALFGTVVHDGYARFLAEPGNIDRADAGQRLTQLFWDAIPVGRPSPGLRAWWRAKLARLAEWCVKTERGRNHDLGEPDAVYFEKAGHWPLLDGRFVITGRADRIERRGNALSVIDYKTGLVPTASEVENGTAPQLILEAMMVEEGAFGAFLENTSAIPEVSEIAYWKLSGGAVDGSVRALFPKGPDKLREVIGYARKQVPLIAVGLLDPTTPFLCAPHPGRQSKRSTYDGISRRAEWDLKL